VAADNSHIIQKMSVRLTAGSKESHGHYSEVLRKIAQQSVEQLEPVLDRVPADTYFHIDTLNVEVNTTESELENLQGKIERALADKLREVLNIGERKGKAEPGYTATKVSAEKRAEELLVHFLKTGRLAWWATPQDMAGARERMDKLSPPDWVAFMRPIIRQSPSVLKRYVNQWPRKSVLVTIKKIVKERFGSESIVDLLNGLLAFDKLKRPAYRKIEGVEPGIYERVLGDLIIKKGEHLIAANMIQSWLQVFGREPNQNGEQLNELKKFLNRQKLVSHGLKEVLEKTYPQKLPDDTAESKAGEKVSENEDKFFVTDEKESVTVQNGGIVILHSYLSRLFSRLGYLENGEFRNQSTRERAVCALHFLATGEAEFLEEELILTKFLCGWPQDEPINRYLDFSDYEREECVKLLSSVISHWKALKNTSVNGLRSSFLQREAILKKEAFGYTLYVEEFTHDILLKRLPWSISVVKLTWMDEMLTVQWRF